MADGPLRILHLNTERTWRGGERQTLWLARELARRGHQGEIACRPGSPLEKEARAAGLNVFSVRPWFEMDPCAASRLRNRLRETQTDILHAHTGHAVGLGALAVPGTAVRLAATRRVDFPLRDNALTRWKYSRAGAVIAISGRVREILIKSGLAPEKIAVVNSGIDASGYPFRADRDRLRREKGYPPGVSLVVNAAALVPHKDHATLLRAARRVRGDAPGARFLILGDGPLRGALEKTARALGLGETVEFLGHRPDVLDFIALADAFVLSSVEEGLGTVLLDALALGTPTAAARAGGIPEIYGADDAPELFPPGNDEALARNLAAVLKDPAEADRRSRRGRERAALFTVARMTDRYEEIYRNLLGKKDA
jgi:L-malate glycosyltransferase